MYHFDANVFGNPSYPLSQSQEGQFMRGGANDVGRGLYREYNPTGPLPITLKYQWSGAEMAQFRIAWQQNTGLNYGANWFTVDLPLMLEAGGEADPALYPYDIAVEKPDGSGTIMMQAFQRYRVHLKTPYTASLVGYDYWGVTLDAEADVSPALVLT